MRLQEKAAIVTGAAMGIGEAVARLFAAEGAKLVLCDIDDQRGEKVARETGAIYVHADVRDESDVKRLVDTAIQQHGRIDVVVNNAGTTADATVVETSVEEWNRVLGVNLKGTYLVSKYAIPHMLERGGSIINIGSIASHIGIARNAAYNASKGGVMLLTRNMAIDYAPYKIRVNAVCPAMIMTPMLEKFIALQPDPDEYVRRVEASTPMGRMGTPQEVAYAALFLASDESSYVTGSALMVDGGYTAR